jgi:hypothetical protein
VAIGSLDNKTEINRLTPKIEIEQMTLITLLVETAENEHRG